MKEIRRLGVVQTVPDAGRRVPQRCVREHLAAGDSPEGKFVPDMEAPVAEMPTEENHEQKNGAGCGGRDQAAERPFPAQQNKRREEQDVPSVHEQRRPLGKEPREGEPVENENDRREDGGKTEFERYPRQRGARRRPSGDRRQRLENPDPVSHSGDSRSDRANSVATV